MHFIHAEDFCSRPNPTWCILHHSWKMIWGNFQTATECPRKPWQPTSIGITWHIQHFSMQSACSVSYCFFFRLCASFQFSSQGTVISMRRTLFFKSDNAMSCCFSVWIMWTGNCRDVLRSTETFQSLAPFSSFILEFFCFLTGYSLCESELWVPWL